MFDALEFIRHRLNWIHDNSTIYPAYAEFDESQFQIEYYDQTGYYWDPILGVDSTIIPKCLILSFQHENEAEADAEINYWRNL